MKKILFLFLIFTLILPAMLIHADNGVNIFVDDKPLEAKGTIVNNSTLVPLRAIFEALGATVQWDGTTRTVTSKKGDITIELAIGNKVAKKNGQQVELAVPGQIIDGLTMVPLRFVVEAFGSEVIWDGATRSVYIKTISQPVEEQVEKPSDEMFILEGNVFTDDSIHNIEVIQLADGRYRLFYHHFNDIKSAISDDGKTYTLEPGVRLQGSMPATILLPDGRYRMYFKQGTVLKSAISDDGYIFNVEPGNRLEPGPQGSIDQDGIIHPSIIQLPDGSYKLYYDGVSPSEESMPRWSIMSAYSSDGLNWTKDPGVRIASSIKDDLIEDDEEIIDDTDEIIEDEMVIDMAFSSHAAYIEGQYILYFTVQADPLSKSGIYRVESKDGINFTNIPVPVLTRDPKYGDSEDNRAGGPLGMPQDPFVLKTAEGERLFYWLNEEGIFSAFIPKVEAKVNSPEISLAKIEYPKPFEEGYFPGFDPSTILASGAGIEVTANSNPLTFKYPFDPFVARSLMVTNKGDSEAVVEFTPGISIIEYDPDGFINHPQPYTLYLKPGERHPIRLIYTLPTGGPQVTNWTAGTEFSAPIIVDLKITRQNYQGTEELKVSFNDVAEVVSPGGPAVIEPKSNALIKGTVYDANTNQPLKDVPVSIFTGRTYIDIRTDSSGSFELGVAAHQRTGTSKWSEFVVSVNQPGPGFNINNSYGQAQAIASPKQGETVELKLLIAQQEQKANYEVVGKLDIGYQAYGWDVSKKGDIMAVVPFHTGLPPSETTDNTYLTVSTPDGELLWKYPIGGETPTVDVSTDGSLIATTLQAKPTPGQSYTSGGKAIVLDRQGNLIFEFEPSPSQYWWGPVDDNITVVQISDDNRFLAAGDSRGRLFLVEINTGELQWESFTNGQVRRLAFDENNQRLFASSGDGYLRSFDLKGELLWKTFVDSWLTDMDVSSNLILATSKSNRAAVHLIDKDTGKINWSYPVEQRGAGVLISPDESYMWYGSEIGRGSTPLGSTVFNNEGIPLFDFGSYGQAAAVTPDSQYILAKGGNAVALFDRNGQLLWQKNLSEEGDGAAMNHLTWISPDASRIVVAINNRSDNRIYGQIYFLKGGIN